MVPSRDTSERVASDEAAAAERAPLQAAVNASMDHIPLSEPIRRSIDVAAVHQTPRLSFSALGENHDHTHRFDQLSLRLDEDHMSSSPLNQQLNTVSSRLLPPPGASSRDWRKSL
ncbi:unnamed protein product [Pleuronectes platessa]|uniref:Uncharacterized protein n=1 Tax=Pleuronectes platessa TaxID=8262 RepID=A0A9N7Y5K4_PLEPL|nr:unnamed protein product [Pleuronectes platessa]